MSLLKQASDPKIEEEQPHEYKEYKSDKGYGWAGALPIRQGLYDPELEKDACGVGFTACVLPRIIEYSVIGPHADVF